MAPLAPAVEITQQLRQLGDIRRDPPRVIASMNLQTKRKPGCRAGLDFA
jgi:hypothetical protein